MEKKILHWITIALGVMTVFVCAILAVLPELKEGWILASERTDAMNGQMNVQIEESQGNKAELYIELPEHIQGKDIVITNDYVRQTVYVKFKQWIEDYSKLYSVSGSSNHIANMSYYKEKEAGVLAIQLDKVYEVSYFYKDGHLCMDFIDPHDMYDKVIVIDAGHGGRMTGAVKREVEEKVLNLDIVKQIQAVFEENEKNTDKKIKLYFTRLDDTNPSLRERVNLANLSDADMFISIHNNASETGLFTSERGTLILYNAEHEKAEYSRRLAELCISHINEQTGSKNQGISNAMYLYIVKNSKVPVSLVEVGYMTNHEELDLLTTEEYQRKVAQGIYDAVMQAIEEGF